MPGFTTHCLFGLNACKKLPKSPLKRMIQKNHAAFNLGLQGPDLFFYFLPSYVIHANNIGAVAHTELTGKFLRHLTDSRKLFSNPTEQQIADAYIAGFLGHYTLDTRCHPFIYWKTGFRVLEKNPDKKKSGRYHGRHVSLEVDIDTALLQYYKHRLPSSFRQHSTILLNRLQLCTIASILYYVYQKTYPQLGIRYTTMRAAIRSMQLGIKWLHDPSGKKKFWLSRVEKLFLGYPLLSSLVPSDTLAGCSDPLNAKHCSWHNPWDESKVSTDSFLDLMEQAEADYLDILDKFNLLICTRFHSPQEQPRTEALMNRLGNHSYHSGLDCSLPS